jgi:O-antigen/teichoic acid export membrane protein
VLLTGPAAAIVALLLLVAVPLLYGQKFHESIGLGFVLLPGVLLLGIGKILSSAIAGRGYPRYALYASAISMPLTLALYFALIPIFTMGRRDRVVISWQEPPADLSSGG